MLFLNEIGLGSKNAWSKSDHKFYLRQKQYGTEKRKEASDEVLLVVTDVQLVSGKVHHGDWLSVLENNANSTDKPHGIVSQIIFVLDFEEDGLKLAITIQENEEGEILDHDHKDNMEGWNFLQQVFDPKEEESHVRHLVLSKFKMLVALNLKSYLLNRILKAYLKDGQFKPKLSKRYTSVHREINLSLLEIVHPVYRDKIAGSILRIMPYSLLATAKAHIGFTFEGDENNDSELPESLVASFYVHRPDLRRPRHLPS
mmetsp:Transcript_8839/g.10116  ORF Transcript_8839/g.10116 Transcript_8839/m.10116 type:complete len:257 (-) Transcript_8839:940-1710(-)